jgi:hypothetical protein
VTNRSRHPDLSPPRATARSRGVSIVEAIISIVIIGTMIVTSVNLVGAARVSDLGMSRLGRADRLAEDLMAEVLAKPYEDTDGAAVFGVETGDGVGKTVSIAGQSTTTGRERFDDVDDYHGYDDDPASYTNGSEMISYGSWSRHVSVEWVDPDRLNSVSQVETGAKRVTIEVKRQGALIATLVGYRTRAWDGTEEGDENVNAAPVAVAGADKTSGASPLSVGFDAGLSFDPNGDTLNYDWDFGDGQTGSGRTVNHSYMRGVYNATVTVTDGRGGMDRNTLTIHVRKAD